MILEPALGARHRDLKFWGSKTMTSCGSRLKPDRPVPRPDVSTTTLLGPINQTYTMSHIFSLFYIINHLMYTVSLLTIRVIQKFQAPHALIGQ